MRFYVPTRARPDCITPRTLVKYGVDPKQIILVVRPDEWKLYRPLSETYQVVVLPKNIEGLSATRQWILEHDEGNGDLHCQIDDDITGFIWKKDTTKWRMRPMDTKMFDAMVTEFEWWLLDGITAVSTQDRVGLARPNGKGFAEYTRVGQVIFLNCKHILAKDWRFDRVKLYADQDMALQIVRGGGITRVSNHYGHTMRPLRAPGGCSVYRDQACIDAAATKLLALHPGLIKLRWKDKDGLSIPSRVISWKKARTQGEAARSSADA